MKHFILYVFGSLILSITNLNGQSYIPFPMNNASWCVSSGYTDGSYVYSYNHYYQYTGVTQVFNQNLYYQLKDTVKEYAQAIWGGNSYLNYFSGYYYLRQDVALKKIYVYDSGINSDKVMLDFNLNVGDILDSSRLYNSNLLIDTLVITSIDSVLLNGTYHQRYNFQPIICPGFYPSDTSLVEGVGMLCGLFTMPSCFEYFSILDQYSQNGQIIYPAGGGGLCSFTGLQSITGDISFELLHTPNPDVFLIVSSANWKGVAEILSVEGKIIGKKAISSNQTEIDLGQTPNGLYFISLRDSHKQVRTFKLILNR